MNSPIFAAATQRRIESRVMALLNDRADFLSEMTAESTRAAGDAIQSIIEERFQDILGDLCGEYSDSFARRAMADLAYKDTMLDFYPREIRKIDSRIKQFEKVKAFWLAKPEAH